MQTTGASDAEAVVVHVNVSSRYEREMLQVLGETADKCCRYGLPLMAIIYPRTEGEDGDYNKMKNLKPQNYAEMLAHAFGFSELNKVPSGIWGFNLP